MRVETTIIIGDGEKFNYPADGAAQRILAAVGGDPTVDFATVNIQQHATGSAGTPPELVGAPPAAP